MISTKGRYALRLLVNIAKHSDNEYTSLKDVSNEEEISIKYLEQVASILTRNKLLSSSRGITGGYKLVKSPSDYKISDILEVMEGTLAPVACLKCDKNTCNRHEKCSTLPFWEKLNEYMKSYLDSKTLQDIIDKNF